MNRLRFNLFWVFIFAVITLPLQAAGLNAISAKHGFNEDYIFYGEKPGGAHDAGPLGGIYQDKHSKSLYLMKTSTKPEEIISEYIGGVIFKKLEGYKCIGCQVDIVKNKKNGLIYISSKYIEGFTDLDKYSPDDKNKLPGIRTILTRFSKLKRESAGIKSTPPDFRYFMKTKKSLMYLAEKKDSKYIFKNYGVLLAASLIIGDYSIHGGNIGFVKNKNLIIRDYSIHGGNIGFVKDTKNNDYSLKRIDFGSAMRDLTNTKIYRTILDDFGQNRNYLLYHPAERFYDKTNGEFLDEIKKLAKIDLGDTISAAYRKIEDMFTEEEINAFWTKRVFPSAAKYQEYQETYQESGEKALMNIMQERQRALLDYIVDGDFPIEDMRVG